MVENLQLTFGSVQKLRYGMELNVLDRDILFIYKTTKRTISTRCIRRYPFSQGKITE